ncbi:sigma-70 family RNA polymerase sigma factor [Streptomyces sp. NPDC012461]|uniref:RNA polymerase sigma factor n=1 Tax=unclassified Streptomyces TaxID=2593676 RepID=UPI0013C24173|nr:sigma-70 family RNA polymerase sigma factor [Streptomyces sp. H28]MBD9735213.1 sigma-70 family RNA polymerase sigma factor [Streptomyces sp. H28]NEC30163.1 sigma-70 family RNA polymerase sigma factor [Streptomyces sp. SID8111]NED21750.1 sigma-70 family RNA polymerase sigma factor [Streptomyces sp. SID9913]
MSLQTGRGTTPEPAWLARARTGDREAFAHLYREHYAFVYRYLLCRTRDRHLAEDLTQEVFARALRGIGGFAWRGTDPVAWLTTIARNLHLDEVGRSRTRWETLVPEFGDPEQPGPGTESLVLRELDAVEAGETVRRALRTLAPPQRHCVELRFLGGLSAEETAHAMGRTVGAVKALTHRAMHKLRWAAGAVPS